MTTDQRLMRAETRLRAAALTWHYLADGPDRGRGRQAVEDLHAAAAELTAALEDAEREGEHDSREEQTQAQADADA